MTVYRALGSEVEAQQQRQRSRFGMLNSELFTTLPGNTGNSAKRRPKQAESSASLTLMQLERYIVHYLVERYNPGIDARMGDQTRLGRWEGGSLVNCPS
jgi:putative transposase